MALISSAATGNFDAGATWVGGVVPGVGDEARAENGHTITITADVTCDEVSNAGTGIFTLNDGVTLTANVTSKSTTTSRNCLQFVAASPASANIIGNVTGGTVSSAVAVAHGSSGTLNITGNATGGSGTSAFGAENNSSGTLNITGNATGGSISSAVGARNNSTGTMNITGSAIGSSVASGAQNNSTGLLTVTRAVGNGFGIGSVGLNSVAGVTSVLSGSQSRGEELEFGSLGQSPIVGAVSVPDLTTNVCLVHRLSSTQKTLIDPSASTGQANQSDVRAGTSYALGNLTGTLAVPAANQVAVGVAVDNTVGTAVLTESTLRTALGMASANLDAQFAAINVDFTPILNRLPAALVSGRMDASVAVFSGSADADITAVLNTLDAVEARLPSALVNGRIDASVGAMAANTLTASALATDAVDEIVDQVWDEPYSQHTTAGTFGKLMDMLRKANTVVDGVVTSAVAATTTSFSSDVNYPTGAFKHAVLLWVNGSSIAEQNSPILSYVNTNGVITVEESFTSIPQVGDEFVIIPGTHVHAIAAIVGAVYGELLDVGSAGSVMEALSALDALRSDLASMIESDGAGQFRFDTIALSQAPGGGGGGDAQQATLLQVKAKTDLITSGSISVLPDRVNDSTITMQFNESTSATVNLDEDTTLTTLQFVVARPDGTDVLTIANASITRTSSSFTVTITTAVTATIGQYLWSLRDISGGGNRVVTKGVLTVQNAAAIDA